MVEMSLNASSQMDGIAKEWDLLLEVLIIEISQLWNLSQHILEINLLVLKKLETQTGNDSMKFNYNGISQFSSVRNRSASSTLDKLGFKSSGTNLNLRYANNSILSDSLFGIQYNISENPIDKYGFQDVYQKIILPYMKINSLFRLPLLVNLFTIMSSSMNTLWIIRPRF